MNIISIKLSNGQYKPILIGDSIPIYIVLKYSVLSLKTKSYKTQYDYLYTIKLLIEYYNLININIQKKIVSGEFEYIFKKVENFINWLYNENSKRITKKGHVSYVTYNNHLYRTREFLVWCNRNFNSKSSPTQKEICELINSHSVSHTTHRTYNSISSKQLADILEFINPDHVNNPFAFRNRLRNYVMVSILTDTGIRLGELLKIKTDDLIRDGQTVYLSIQNRNNDTDDIRNPSPRLKNNFGERLVVISNETYWLLDKYLLYERKKNKKHSYLFTSDRQGNPLSKKSVSHIFSVISKELKVKFTPHLLRHNFAERMLKYLVETREVEMERAKDELRTICGWSPGSIMPNLYTRNYISQLANRHNLERIKSENE